MSIKGAVQGELLKLSTATAVFTRLRVQQDTMTGQGSVGPVTLRRAR